MRLSFIFTELWPLQPYTIYLVCLLREREGEIQRGFFLCIQHKCCAVTGHWYFSDFAEHVFLQTDTGSTGQQFKRMLFILGLGVVWSKCKVCHQLNVCLCNWMAQVDKIKRICKYFVKYTHIHGLIYAPWCNWTTEGESTTVFFFFLLLLLLLLLLQATHHFVRVQDRYNS